MEAVLVACAAVLVAILVAIGLLLKTKLKTKTILFIDAPDPDNPAAAMAVWRYVLGKKGRIHIVLTGRPINLRTGKHFSESTPLKKQIARQKWSRVCQSML